MLIWRYVVLFVCSMLVLSTFVTSIILTSQKVCFELKVSLDGITIHVDSQCSGPKDEHRDMRNDYSERPTPAIP